MIKIGHKSKSIIFLLFLIIFLQVTLNFDCSKNLGDIPDEPGGTEVDTTKLFFQNLPKMKWMKILINAPITEKAGSTFRYYPDCKMPFIISPAYFDTNRSQWNDLNFSYKKSEGAGTWEQDIAISANLSQDGKRIENLNLAHFFRLGRGSEGGYRNISCTLSLENIPVFMNSDTLYCEYRYKGDDPHSVIKVLTYQKNEKDYFMDPIISWSYSRMKWSDTAYISIIFSGDKSKAGY